MFGWLFFGKMYLFGERSPERTPPEIFCNISFLESFIRLCADAGFGLEKSLGHLLLWVVSFDIHNDFQT